eukprot:4979974-Prymnesium_polylepis.3
MTRCELHYPTVQAGCDRCAIQVSKYHCPECQTVFMANEGSNAHSWITARAVIRTKANKWGFKVLPIASHRILCAPSEKDQTNPYPNDRIRAGSLQSKLGDGESH